MNLSKAINKALINSIAKECIKYKIPSLYKNYHRGILVQEPTKGFIKYPFTAYPLKPSEMEEFFKFENDLSNLKDIADKICKSLKETLPMHYYRTMDGQLYINETGEPAIGKTLKHGDTITHDYGINGKITMQYSNILDGTSI